MNSGIVNILKPQGMTSHDVVAKVRKIFKTKKVGHTRTLDPDAVGVLPVCVGQGTRLVEYLMEKEKVYKVIMHFGKETDTQDASGQVVKETNLCELSREEFLAVLADFIGEIEQIPPMYSAVKKDGQPLYKLARAGVSVEVAPRKVTISEIKLLMFTAQSAMLEVTCSKGTYIRTLCQDIGRKAGTSGYMSYLLRLRSGRFGIDESITLDKLAHMEAPEEALISLTDALADMATIVFETPKAIKYLANGLEQRLDERLPEGVYKAVDGENQLLAVGHIKGDYFKPDKVFKAGE